MKLGSELEILDGLPIAYVRSMDALACSDLHLGYEGVSARRGMFIPKTNLKRIKAMLKRAVDRTKASQLILVGDIKNEFSEVYVEEFNEFSELIGYLRKELDMRGITLIKGNHDNFIDRYRDAAGIEICRQEKRIGSILFFHGEEMPVDSGAKVFIMGHVHPAIAVYNGVGVKEKLRCFLYGRFPRGRELLVLPAMNYFADGTEVNNGDVSGMAPVFRKMFGMGKMRAFCMGEDETLDFGTVSELSAIRY